MKTVRYFALVACLCAVGCSPEGEIKEKALELCRYDLLRDHDLSLQPKALDPAGLLRPADIEFMSQRKGSSGFAAAMKPALRAIAEAQSKHTTCEVVDIQLGDASATVQLTQTKPKFGKSGDLSAAFEQLGSLGDLESHDARVAKVDDWFSSSDTEVTTDTATLQFVKSDGEWLADLQLPEQAAKREEASKLRDEARDLFERRKPKEALAKAKQALKLEPEHESFAELTATIEEEAKQVVAGGWRFKQETDEMTDQVNAFATLYAEEGEEAPFGVEFPSLMVRCSEGELDAYVNMTSVIDAHYTGRVKARYRFDQEEAQDVKMSRSTDMSGAFFPDAGEWASRLAKHDGSVFRLEAPMVMAGDSVAMFDLTGASVAIPKVREACE